MSDTDKLQSEYMKLIKLKKQYEGVLRTTRNPSQQQRVSKDVQSIEHQIDHLKKQVSPEEFESWEEDSSSSPAAAKQNKAFEDYQNLSSIYFFSYNVHKTLIV